MCEDCQKFKEFLLMLQISDMLLNSDDKEFWLSKIQELFQSVK